jgi:ABC-type sugar transport system ATPase subunit
MLHIDGVTQTYPGVRALDRATLDIGPGVFSLLGANGAR